MDVVENAGRNRFELSLDGGTAFVSYRRDGDRLVLDHTEVPPQFAGKGVGSKLAKGVFEALRASGRKAVVRCEFLQGWIAKHPEYADTVEG
ncbi:GNAT family N-acetyltransferase [Paracoccus sp. (in: a-proteobacteria)]|uniref:GNAT family N-acetyltransferase n=1 Tax=Paracoccus sp. TaxID=267 RepID=UPI003220858D